MSGEIKRSTCPYDCPDTCGLLVEVADGRAVKVSGDPEHPFTRGVLCPKMNHYEKTVHSPLRLAIPCSAHGPKGSGDFRPISWEEAIRQIASRWREIIAGYGAEAILPYSYAGHDGPRSAQLRPSFLLPPGRFPAGPDDLLACQGSRLESGHGRHRRAPPR